jgi:hypothetical protein
MSTEDVCTKVADNKEKESSDDESNNDGGYSSVHRGNFSDAFENNSVDCNGSVQSTWENRTKVDTKRSYESNMDKIGLSDAFCTESPTVKNSIQTRITRINEETAFKKTILASVDHFQLKMEREVATLIRCHEECTERIHQDEQEHESNVRESMERYFTDHMSSRAN